MYILPIPPFYFTSSLIALYRSYTAVCESVIYVAVIFFHLAHCVCIIPIDTIAFSVDILLDPAGCAPDGPDHTPGVEMISVGHFWGQLAAEI